MTSTLMTKPYDLDPDNLIGEGEDADNVNTLILKQFRSLGLVFWGR